MPTSVSSPTSTSLKSSCRHVCPSYVLVRPCLSRWFNQMTILRLLSRSRRITFLQQQISTMVPWLKQLQRSLSNILARSVSKRRQRRVTRSYFFFFCGQTSTKQRASSQMSPRLNPQLVWSSFFLANVLHKRRHSQTYCAKDSPKQRRPTQTIFEAGNFQSSIFPRQRRATCF